MHCTVEIGAEKRVLEAERGEDLLALLRRYGLAPDAPCGGEGKCGKCRVLVHGREVLACQTAAEDGMTVTLPKAVGTDWGEAPLPALGVENPCDGLIAAFDIGTTTLVCRLLSARDGRELAAAGMLNPQSVYGADVLTRLRLARSGQADALRSVLCRGMEELLTDLCASAEASPSEVVRLSVVGNSAMQQLFLGMDTTNLTEPPFAPVLREGKTVAAAPYFPLTPASELLLVPDIAGYIGADTVGAVLAARLYERKDTALLVDIGTNGEMVMIHKGKMAACSTAAGPALEGAGIEWGMRAAPGAIDRVWTENGAIRAHVMGEGEAKGICGCGLVSAAAALRRSGLADRRGKILPEGRVTLSGDVTLSTADLRALLLCKGSIAAGIELLAAHLGAAVEDIDELLLCGAFGSHLDGEAACDIGLLPPALRARITPLGNAAGEGAAMLGCRPSYLALAERLAGEIESVELASQPDFARTFAAKTYL